MSFTQFQLLIEKISHVPVARISPDASFRDDLGIDSLQMVNLLVELAEQTDFQLETLSDSSEFSTPARLYALMNKGD
ncbi:acyl carrier protein [Virgibacillus senegalensis]|uniref:acyl carrier protein n=1 Tax=Virgibacillus senegalensis TaxID=1499679 RepID=UPI00069D8561|nr:phosphopantetheine-binding protein [Virgibacillus senegalensis]